MQLNRPIVMSIAGLDPCGGAGLLADIKTFEQHKVYGLGITTAQTLQTESSFIGLRWENTENILRAVREMLGYYEVKAVKIGIVQHIRILWAIVNTIHEFDDRIKIIVDPVIRSTTAFDFWENEIEENILYELLKKTTLITPNYIEVTQLTPCTDPKSAARKLSEYCGVLLKGGHNDTERGIDYLFINGATQKIPPCLPSIFPKHGSGCILSSSIAANLALGYDLESACVKGKHFTEKILISNPSLLGFYAT